MTDPKPASKTARRLPDHVQLSTDAGNLIVLLVGGAKPYLWIGRLGDGGDEYLDSIDLERVQRATKRVSRRAG